MPEGTRAAPQPKPRPRLRTLLITLLPIIILIVGVVISFGAYDFNARTLKNEASTRFVNEEERGLTEITARMRSYEDAVQGAHGMLVANPKATREQWRQYVQVLELEQRYPALVGLGFVSYVPANERSSFVDSTRADNAPNFTVRPMGNRPDYLVVKYIEPADKNNVVVGFDVGADPAQRAAAERARDTGLTTISEKLTLPQDPTGKAGFVMFVPVYKNEAGPSRNPPQMTADERRKNLVGWVYGALLPAETFVGLLSTDQTNLDFEVFDSTDPSLGNMLWDSDEGNTNSSNEMPLLSDRKHIQVSGRTWTVGISSLPSFEASFTGPQPAEIGAVGVVLSFLIATVLYSFINTGRNAQLLAERRTMALRESEERFRLITDNAADLIAVVDKNNRRLYNSPSYINVLGYTPDELGRTSALEQIHPDDRAFVEQIARESLVTGTGRTIEYRMRHKNGHYLTLESIGSVIRDERGEPENLVVVGRDITERKNTENRLRRQSEAMRELTTSRTLEGGDIEAALKTITEVVAGAAEVERVSVWLYNEAHTKIELVDLYERTTQRHSHGLELSKKDYPAYFKALEQERAIVADDAHAHPATHELSASYLTKHNISSILDAPVHVGNRTLGVVCHEQVDAPRHWTLEEGNFAGAVADLVSLVLEANERKRAEDTLRRQNEYLSGLQQTTLGLVSHLNLEKLLNDIVTRAAALVGVQHGYIALVEPDGSEMSTRVGVGVFAQRIGDRLKPGQGLAGQVWQIGQPLTVDDYQKLPSRVPGSNLDILHALAAFPLKSGEGIVGVLGVARDQAGRAFNQEELAALNQFASLASVAFDNARLYDELEVVVEQRTAELRSSEERYRTIIENIQDGYYELDLSGNLTFFNDALVRIVEFPREELIGLNFRQYTDAETASRLLRAYTQLYRSGEPVPNIEYDVYRHGVKTKTLAVSASLIRNAEAKPTGFRGIVRDVTERKRSEEAVRRQAAYLAALQDTTLGLVSRLDVNELLRDIVVRAGQLVGTENGYVYLVEADGAEMQLRVGTGLYDDLVGAKTRPGSGLAGLAWQSGEPMVIEDYQQWPQRLPGARRDLLRAVVGVPLKSREQTVGVIGLAYTQEGRQFGESEMNVLTRFAQLAAVALDNAQLYQETQRRMSEFVVINDVGQALTTSFNLRETLQIVTERIAKNFNVGNAYVALYDRKTNMVEIPYSLEGGEPQSVLPFPFGEGLTSQIIRTAKPLLINRDATARAMELGAKVIGDPTRSYLGVPVIAGDEVIGVVSVQSTEHEGLFGDADIRLLSTIAANLGVAIQNARLYQQTQQRANEMAVLHDTARAIGQRMEAAQLFETVYQEIQHLMPQDAFFIATYDETKNLLTYDLMMDEGQRYYDLPAQPPAGRTKIALESGEAVLNCKSREEMAAVQARGERAAGTGKVCVSALFVPITLGDRKMGIMSIQSYEFDAYDQHHVELATNVANGLAVALDNARLYQETRQSLTETQTLYDMSVRLNTAQTLEQVLEAAAAPIVRNGKGTASLLRLETNASGVPESSVMVGTVNPIPSLSAPPGTRLQVSRSPLSKLWLADPNNPVILQNPHDDKRLDEAGGALIPLNGTQALAILPLHVSGRWVGLLTFSWDEPHPFTDAEVRLYKAIAAQTATVLDNRLLFEQAQRTNQYLNALQETSLGLITRLDVNELLRDLVHRAGDLVGTDNGYVYLVEAGDEEMQLLVGTGLYDDLIGSRTRRGSGLAGLVWESGQPLALDDYQKWPQRLPGARRDFLRAVVGVPLKSGPDTVGVIGLAFTDETRKFGDAEIQVLTRFAQLASIALDNARLYQETERRLEEVAALASLSQALTGRLNVNEISRLVVEHLKEIVPQANAYVVSLYDKVANHIEIPYSLEGETVQTVAPFPLGHGVASHIIQRREPVFINRDAERRIRELGAITVGKPARSYLGVPIIVGDEVIGTLSVQNVEQEGLFDENDVRLLSTIAANVGVALRNAQLFQETHRAQTFLDSVVENLPFMVWVKDSREFRYVSANRAFEDILGIARAEVIGKTAAEVLGQEDAERTLAQDREVVSTLALLDIPEETVMSRTRGARVFRTHKIPILRADGQPEHVLGISEDITERKKADEERMAFERKLLETQKLESLGVLAGGIAHDFNNLLVSILGNVGLALLDLDPISPAREPVEQIKVAAQRAADLTKQMLAYSGKGRFVMQRLNLNAIIEEMTQLLKVSISKSALLHFNLGQNLPNVEADATQIRQIVMNLIVNASDAIGAQDGVITLNTGLVQADRTYLSDWFMAPDLVEGNYVYLEVADTGVGMDTETLKKIFEPFFTTKFTGRGLGLAAVLGIVRGHKGAIKVYSEPGKGTIFRVLLPCLEGTSQMDDGQKSGNRERGAGLVLVVDDEEVVRNVTKRMLERFGYAAILAPDGREGVDVYKLHMDQVAIVLLDMTMPHMSGEETFHALRLIRPEVKVLLMSGYTEQEATSRFAGKGLAGFLQKPYTPQELHEKIQSILTSK